MSHSVVDLLRDLRPEAAGRVDDIFPLERRIAMFEAIVAHERPAATMHTHRVRSGRGRRQIRTAALGAGAVAVAVAAFLLPGSNTGPQSAAAAVAFHTAASGDIVATVTDPFAAESQLKAAFAEHGFDITVSLAPVSPSLVGTVVYMSDMGGGSSIQALQGGHCVTGGGGCPIGLRIPASFTGAGYITLGRAAKPGETYDSQASAFAPGEALHCSGLLGARVESAVAVLQADNLTATWRENATATTQSGTQTSFSRSDTTPPAANFIWDAVMTAPRSIIVWTKPTPWPADAAHGASVNAGCTQ
jgi:hypothetical protein